MISRRDVLKTAGLLLLPAGASGFSLPIQISKPLPNLIYEDGFVRNEDEIFGDWEHHSQSADGIKQIRTGWCNIPKERPFLWLDPDTFLSNWVTGKVKLAQGRIIREGYWFYTPTIIRDASQATCVLTPWEEHWQDRYVKKESVMLTK